MAWKSPRAFDYRCVKMALLDQRDHLYDVWANQRLDRPLTRSPRDAVGPLPVIWFWLETIIRNLWGTEGLRTSRCYSSGGRLQPRGGGHHCRVYDSEEFGVTVALCISSWAWSTPLPCPWLWAHCKTALSPWPLAEDLPTFQAKDLLFFTSQTIPSQVPVPTGLIHIQCTCQWGDKITLIPDLLCCTWETPRDKTTSCGSWVNVYCLTETRPCQGHQRLTQVQGTGKAFPWPMCRLLATHEESVHFTSSCQMVTLNNC